MGNVQRSDYCGIIEQEIPGEEVYIRAVVNGKAMMALLDTGCELTIVGTRVLPEIQLEETNHKIFAANGTSIPLVGQTNLNMVVGRKSIQKSALVSEVVSECILGVDWLKENKCLWDFGKGRIRVNGIWIQLYRKDGSIRARNIYVAEETLIPFRQGINISVEVPCLTFQPGDMVRYFSPRNRPGRGRKWQLKNDGPFMIEKRVNSVNYVFETRTP